MKKRYTLEKKQWDEPVEHARCYASLWRLGCLLRFRLGR